MAIKVYIPTPYRDLTAGQAHVNARGSDVLELIRDLDRLFPGLRERICDNSGIRHHVNVFVNGQEVRCLQGETTPLAADDEVAFIPALVGGSEHYRPVSDRHRGIVREPCGLGPDLAEANFESVYRHRRIEDSSDRNNSSAS